MPYCRLGDLRVPTETYLNTSGDEVPLDQMVEMVRVRRAFTEAAREIGGGSIESRLVSVLEDRERAAAILSFALDGMLFEVRVALLRGTH